MKSASRIFWNVFAKHPMAGRSPQFQQLFKKTMPDESRPLEECLAFIEDWIPMAERFLEEMATNARADVEEIAIVEKVYQTFRGACWDLVERQSENERLENQRREAISEITRSIGKWDRELVVKMMIYILQKMQTQPEETANALRSLCAILERLNPEVLEEAMKEVSEMMGSDKNPPLSGKT